MAEIIALVTAAALIYLLLSTTATFSKLILTRGCVESLGLYGQGRRLRENKIYINILQIV